MKDYSFITNSTNLTKNTNLIYYEKTTHLHLSTMKSLNEVPLTRTSSLVRVQLFQKLGG